MSEGFYFHRDVREVGWRPYNEKIALELKEKDKRLGIDSFAYKGLYQNDEQTR